MAETARLSERSRTVMVVLGLLLLSLGLSVVGVTAQQSTDTVTEDSDGSSYDVASISGVVTNNDGEPLPESAVYVSRFQDVNGNTVTIEPIERIDPSKDAILNAEFRVEFRNISASVRESEVVTGRVLRDGYSFSQISSVTLTRDADPEEGFTFLTFPSLDEEEAQYTLNRVPAQQDVYSRSGRLNGVDYTVLQGQQLGTGETGTGSVDDVLPGFNPRSDIIIDTEPVASGPDDPKIVDDNIPKEVGVDESFDASVTVNRSENTLITVESDDFDVNITTQDPDGGANGNEAVFLNLGNKKELTHTFKINISNSTENDTGVVRVVDNSDANSFSEVFEFEIVNGSDAESPADFPGFEGSDDVFGAIDDSGDGSVTPAEMSQAVGEFLQDGTVSGNDVSPAEMSQVVGWFLSR
jgi:hypothetical protein